MSLAPQTGTTEKVWSRWPWVSSTAAGRSRCRRRTSSSGSTASMPGSTTRQRSPAAAATTQQLVPGGPAGNPVTSTSSPYGPVTGRFQRPPVTTCASATASVHGVAAVSSSGAPGMSIGVPPFS